MLLAIWPRSAGESVREDLSVSTELPYSDIVVDYSHVPIVNDAHITREGGSEQIASDSASIAKYLRHSYNQSNGLHYSNSVALNAGQWIVNFRKDPKIRIERLTIKPHRQPDD